MDPELLLSLLCAALLMVTCTSPCIVQASPCKPLRRCLMSINKSAETPMLPLSYSSAAAPRQLLISSQLSETGYTPHLHLPTFSIVVISFACFVLVCIVLLSIISFIVRSLYKEKDLLFPSCRFFTSTYCTQRFTLKEVESFTSNFCHKLGRKTNSSIYKGWMDGRPIVVKRVNGGHTAFLNAVHQASRINHPNLVELLGFCSEGSEKMLVYEYLEAGSLDTVLLKDTDDFNWETRYGIATKVAEVLLFLHEECGECLVHGNVKLENIMLGDSFCPKLADFGVAEFSAKERVMAWKNANRSGSNGGSSRNLSPAWLNTFKASAASDVYGFGIVLLSLVLGRGNIIDALSASNDPIFLEWIYLQAKAGMYEDALDGRLMLEATPKEVRVAVQLAFCCMQDDPSARPTMHKAWQVLRDREELGLPLLASMAFGGCSSSDRTDDNSNSDEVQVVVLDVEKDKELDAVGCSQTETEGNEPCYQVFSLRSHRRSTSSISSV